jgi:DNA repair protein RadC
MKMDTRKNLINESCDAGSGAYPIPVFRLQLVKEAEGMIASGPINSPADVLALLPDVAQADREHMVALYLDTKHRVLGRHTISIGTLNASLIHPREVFKVALMLNAHALLLLVHNHPSGDITPSIHDDRVTRAIAKAGELLEVRLLDHIIIGPALRCYSYKEHKPELFKGDES